MSVSDGQKVDAAVTNAAFVSRTVDDNTVGKKDLQNTDPASGSDIINLQRNLNSIFSFLGQASNQVFNNTPTWLSDAIGVASESVKNRIDAIQTQVETNDADIATNTGNISTNTGNISTNTTNISTNTDNLNDINSTVGVTLGDTDLGTGFSTIIGNNSDVRSALIALESALIPITDGLDFQGLWNANTNTPTLVSSTGTKGHFYIVDTAGTTSLDGIADWQVGDWAVFDGTVWRKVDNTDSVTSVNTQTGAVVLDADDISDAATTNKFVTAADVTKLGHISVTQAVDLDTIESDTATNNSKVSADGSIDTHSDVDVTTVAPTTGQVLEYDGTNFVPATVAVSGADNAGLIENLGINTSVAASALTVGIRQADGSTAPTVGSPVTISFRNATPGLGSYTKVSVTSSINITITSGATLGHRNATDEYIYVYALNNSGTVELAVSTDFYDEGSIVSTTAMSAAADTNGIFSTTARSNVSIRLIARLKSNQTTAGTWAANASEVSVASQHVIKQPYELISATSSTKTPTASGNFNNMTGNSITLGAGKWRLLGTMDFGSSGGPIYSLTRTIWASADGADNGTPPTALSSATGLTIDSGFADNVRGIIWYFTANSMVMPAETLTVTTDRPVEIFLVSAQEATTVANARVTAYLAAERIVK